MLSRYDRGPSALRPPFDHSLCCCSFVYDLKPFVPWWLARRLSHIFIHYTRTLYKQFDHVPLSCQDDRIFYLRYLMTFFLLPHTPGKRSMILGSNPTKQAINGYDPMPMLLRSCKPKLLNCIILLKLHATGRSTSGVISPTRRLPNGGMPLFFTHLF